MPRARAAREDAGQSGGGQSISFERQSIFDFLRPKPTVRATARNGVPASDQACSPIWPSSTTMPSSDEREAKLPAHRSVRSQFSFFSRNPMVARPNSGLAFQFPSEVGNHEGAI